MRIDNFRLHYYVAAIGLWVGLSETLSATEPESRRNIIFVLVDDQRWDAMSCMGHPFLKTPAVDSLAKGWRPFCKRLCDDITLFAQPGFHLDGTLRAHAWCRGQPHGDES